MFLCIDQAIKIKVREPLKYERIAMIGQALVYTTFAKTPK